MRPWYVQHRARLKSVMVVRKMFAHNLPLHHTTGVRWDYSDAPVSGPAVETLYTFL